MELLEWDSGSERYLDRERLEKVFRYFSEATGLDVSLYDTDGAEKLGVRRDAEHAICRMASGDKKCRESVRYAGRKSAELGEPYIYNCGCGLVQCSAPVLLEGKLLGSIVCGPVLLWEKDEYAADELRHYTKDMDLTDAQRKNVLDACREITCVNMTAAAELLFLVVNDMCREQSAFLKQHSEMTRQQMRIADLIAEKKQNAAALAVMERTVKLNSYPRELEKELISYVQLGDKPQAVRILNNLLGEIFSLESGNMDTVRVHLYELVAVLSRAAVDAGAPLEAVTDSVKKSARILLEDMDFEELCYLTREIMDGFIAAVYRYRDERPASAHLSNAISFIKQHFAEQISLETVAQKVYVSAYYLSHLFREEMNTTFSDYVAKVRMEQARYLLKDKSLKVQDVAGMVGIADANYFTKLFKRFYGVNPKNYKEIYS